MILVQNWPKTAQSSWHCSFKRIEYCLGNSFELLSDSIVIVVCQDSNVFLDQHKPIDYSSMLLPNVVFAVWPKKMKYRIKKNWSVQGFSTLL